MTDSKYLINKVIQPNNWPAPLTETPPPENRSSPHKKGLPPSQLLATANLNVPSPTTAVAGSALQLPQLSENEKEKLVQIYAGKTPEQTQALQAISTDLATAAYKAAASGTTGVNTSQGTPIAQQFNNAVVNYQQQQKTPEDGNAAAQSVFALGVQGIQNQLIYYSQQVQNSVNVENGLEGDIQQFSQAVGNWPAGKKTQNFTYTTYDSYGTPTVHTNQPLTKEQASALQSNLQDQLNTQNDVTQMQQFQLQNLTQEYNQAFTTLSNLSKSGFDTVKNTINNTNI